MNANTGDDIALFLKELVMPDGAGRPYSMWFSGEYPRVLDGLCKLVSLDMRVCDPAWIGMKLRKLLNYSEASGSFMARIPGSNKKVNITRFNPLEDAFENLFRGVPVWLPKPETRAPAPMQFRMDVTENDKEYQVAGELPGVKKGGDQHNYYWQRSCGIRGSEARKRRQDRRDGGFAPSAITARSSARLRSVRRSTK